MTSNCASFFIINKPIWSCSFRLEVLCGLIERHWSTLAIVQRERHLYHPNGRHIEFSLSVIQSSVARLLQDETASRDSVRRPSCRNPSSQTMAALSVIRVMWYSFPAIVDRVDQCVWRANQMMTFPYRLPKFTTYRDDTYVTRRLSSPVERCLA